MRLQKDRCGRKAGSSPARHCASDSKAIKPHCTQPSNIISVFRVCLKCVQIVISMSACRMGCVFSLTVNKVDGGLKQNATTRN